MEEEEITRQHIIRTLVVTLLPLDYVQALWEAGAAAFNRLDEYSDIDLYVVCKDGKVEDTLEAMKQSLISLSEMDMSFRLPEPTWHGHSQVFWRLKNVSPFLFLDIVVMKKSSKNKFLQYAIHGEPVVYFDKTDMVKDNLVEPTPFLQKLMVRLSTLKTIFPLFQTMTIKELNRGHPSEAFAFYFSYTLRPLMEAIRIKHCPYHYNFFTSYLHYDLSPVIIKRLHRFFFIKDAGELKERRAEAEKWFWQIVKSIHMDELRKKVSDTEL